MDLPVWDVFAFYGSLRLGQCNGAINAVAIVSRCVVDIHNLTAHDGLGMAEATAFCCTLSTVGVGSQNDGQSSILMGLAAAEVADVPLHDGVALVDRDHHRSPVQPWKDGQWSPLRSFGSLYKLQSQQADT